MTHSSLYSKHVSINICWTRLNWTLIDKNLVALSPVYQWIGFRVISQSLALGHTPVLKKEMRVGRWMWCRKGRKEITPFPKRQENEIGSKMWTWGSISRLEKQQVWFDAEPANVRTLFLKSILLPTSSLSQEWVLETRMLEVRLKILAYWLIEFFSQSYSLICSTTAYSMSS